MARFCKLITDSKPDGVWINIDTIVSMYYDKDFDATYIFSCDDPCACLTAKGDITNDILNANNELTMRDKNYANYIFNKFKMSLSCIVARLDSILRATENI